MELTVESIRNLIVRAIRENPAALRSDPADLAALDEPTRDFTFEDLDFDSLARMELSIWLQLEAGIELSEGEINDHPSVNGLVRFLAARGPRLPRLGGAAA